MADKFVVRLATPQDAPLIARHRAEMFSDMAQLTEDLYEVMVRETVTYLEEALATGAYHGWLASDAAHVDTVIGGAGIQLRRTLPHPLMRSGTRHVARGRQAIVLNVFTEKAWRRQGVAELLMAHVIEWARNSEVDTLVLHSSAEGRALYERLGFVPTNEMKYPGL